VPLSKIIDVNLAASRPPLVEDENDGKRSYINKKLQFENYLKTPLSF
jgi:hypothetical protein